MWFFPYFVCALLGVDSLRGALAEGNRIAEIGANCEIAENCGPQSRPPPDVLLLIPSYGLDGSVDCSSDSVMLVLQFVPLMAFTGVPRMVKSPRRGC